MSQSKRDLSQLAAMLSDDSIVRFVDLPGGIRLEYVEQGDPTGTPVLLLHGLADSWRSFGPLLAQLPGSIHAFAISLRGHGGSGRPAAGYGPRDFATDLANFVEAAGLQRVVVVGHSMSSVVALRFALDFPDHTLALVLVSWRGRPRPAAVQAMATLTDPIDPAFVEGFVAASFAQPPAEEAFKAMVRECLKTPARVWRAVLNDFMADDLSAELGTIAAPARIAWGDQDATCPRSEQEALAATLPAAQLAIYPGVGHSLHWENPTEFAADLVTFVEGVTARR